MRKWVIDASPLITLAKIGQVYLLSELCDEMVIPGGVAEEIQRSPAENDPGNMGGGAAAKGIMKVGLPAGDTKL